MEIIYGLFTIENDLNCLINLPSRVCGYVGGVECCTWCFLLTNSPHVLQIAYRKEKFSLFLRRTSERRRNVGSSLLNFYLDRIFLFWENFQDKSQRMRLPVTFFLIGWIKIRFCNISSHNNNSMEQMEWKTSCLCVRESSANLWTTIEFIECTCISFTEPLRRVFGLRC